MKEFSLPQKKRSVFTQILKQKEYAFILLLLILGIGLSLSSSIISVIESIILSIIWALIFLSIITFEITEVFDLIDSEGLTIILIFYNGYMVLSKLYEIYFLDVFGYFELFAIGFILPLVITLIVGLVYISIKFLFLIVTELYDFYREEKILTFLPLTVKEVKKCNINTKADFIEYLSYVFHYFGKSNRLVLNLIRAQYDVDLKKKYCIDTLQQIYNELPSDEREYNLEGIDNYRHQYLESLHKNDLNSIIYYFRLN